MCALFVTVTVLAGCGSSQPSSSGPSSLPRQADEAAAPGVCGGRGGCAVARVAPLALLAASPRVAAAGTTGGAAGGTGGSSDAWARRRGGGQRR